MPKTKTKPAMMVKDAMTTRVEWCSPHETLSAAAQRMWDADCGVLPVIADGRVISMVTDRDVCMAAFTQNQPLSQLPVETAMSKRLITCQPDEDCEDVLQTMREYQIRRIPVVDDQGQLEGILTLNDLACESLKIDGRVPQTEIVETMNAIGECRWREEI